MWDLGYFLEVSIAPCRSLLRRCLVTSGRNSTDCLTALRYMRNFSIMTAMDQTDITNRKKATALAGTPIWFHIPIQ
jgi:hypothetical protein